MIVGSNILAGASGQGGYFLNRSIRTRSSASAYFNRTPSASGSQTIWTWSAWVKRGILNVTPFLLSAAEPSGTTDYDAIDLSADTLRIYFRGGNSAYLQTTQVFRDPSSWYHIIVSVDTTQATSSNRIKLYVNGVQVTAFSSATYPIQNYATYFNINGRKNTISAAALPTPSGFFDGYQTEINFIDGQALTPTSFGAFNPVTGVWQPIKYVGTYGTNGFYLNFNDNSAATAAAIGKDSSGNGNNWTPNGISVTAGVTYDSMTDVPTLTNATTANYAVLNPLYTLGSAKTFADGNLKCLGTANAGAQAYGTPTIQGIIGKFYLEAIPSNLDSTTSSYIGGFSSSVAFYAPTGQLYNGSSWVAYGASYTTNDVIGLAFDTVAGTIEFFKNGVSQGQRTGLLLSLGFDIFSSSNAASVVPSWTFNFGQRPFSYTPPSGFNRLNTYNLPAPTIVNGLKQMGVSLWTGDGSSNRAIPNNVQFTPDFVWQKSRSAASFGGNNNQLYDSVRGFGLNKDLASNLTAAEGGSGSAAYGYLSSVDSVNLNTTVGASGSQTWNQNTIPYVAWQWKASNAPAVTNTAGSISSQVSANPSAGFSVATFTAPASGQFTIGHGLGVAPAFVTVKNLVAASTSWWTYHSALGINNVDYVALNLTNAEASFSTMWGSGGMTSSTCGFTVGGSVNASVSHVAYIWASVAGYSAFGSYTGNGSADGTFVYLGLRPRFILIKNITSASNWMIMDTSRLGYNVNNYTLSPNLTGTEQGYTPLDILSNGFKIRTTDSNWNTSSNIYIYAAFAENPFNYSLAR
jgi:hypothetical protein